MLSERPTIHNMTAKVEMRIVGHLFLISGNSCGEIIGPTQAKNGSLCQSRKTLTEQES